MRLQLKGIARSRLGRLAAAFSGSPLAVVSPPTNFASRSVCRLNLCSSRGCGEGGDRDQQRVFHPTLAALRPYGTVGLFSCRLFLRHPGTDPMTARSRCQTAGGIVSMSMPFNDPVASSTRVIQRSTRSASFSKHPPIPARWIRTDAYSSTAPLLPPARHRSRHCGPGEAGVYWL